VLAGNANGQQSLQPGFYSHEPQGVTLHIESANLGYLCGDATGPAAFCEQGRGITVTDRESCTGTDGNEYLCTRYGYQFDYTGAVPGDTIECRSTRKDPVRSRSMDYSLTLDAEKGSVLQPSWLPYNPVDQRTMLTEVHDCTYQGERLATIEFIVIYEPETGSASAAIAASASSGPASGIELPYIAEIPNSCHDLTDTKAASMLQVESVQGSTSNEHVANLSSTCSFTSTQAPFRTVLYLYKFMPYDMFDSNTLSKQQMVFNATMIGGGHRPYKVIEDLGKFTFLFDSGARTTVMVVTGIQGPMGGGIQAREFLATYYLEDPNRSHEDRLQSLMQVARASLPGWIEMSRKP
jgi:hypothetical protein